jgi:superfamily II DNA or RNA helicase
MLTILNASEKATAHIVDRLSLRNPQWTERARMKLSLVGIDERLSFVQEYPHSIIAPRGTIKIIRQELLRCDHDITIVDKRTTGYDLDIRLTDEIIPRDYQQEAIEQIQKQIQGTIILPCGTGKTKLAVLAILAIKKSTLVIVPTKEIMSQWTDDVRNILGYEAGNVGDGKKDFQPITIAILNSLDTLESYDELSQFGLILHDECHRSCAKTNQRVLSFAPAKYRIGLTATRIREDHLEKLIDWTFGDVIFERHVQEMVAKKWLMMPELVNVKTDFTFDYHGPDEKRIEALSQAIVQDTPRMNLVRDLIKTQHEDPKRSILVLANRKEYCHRIKESLEADGLDPLVVTGETPKKPRKKAIEQVRNGSRRILIATSLADEGMDIPRLSDVILAFPESARARTIQRIGRVMRPVEGKYPMLFDIVDPLVPTLVNRWNERKRTYKSLGLIY